MDNKLACNILNSYYQKHMQSGHSKPEYFIESSQCNGRYTFTATCKFKNHEEKASAFSKQEAKRLSACLMLMYLAQEDHLVPYSMSMERISSTENQEVDLEQARHDALSTHLKQRSIDLLGFNRLFVQELTCNLESHLNETNAFKKVDSPKSKTLNNLLECYEELKPSENTPLLFELILKEMGLQYFCEFLETKVLSNNILMIKINFNLITVMGRGNTPSEAIFMACLEAIKLLCVFNL